MKKLLLFAVAALVAGSVSAQVTFTKVGSAKKSTPQTAVKMKNMQQEKSTVFPKMAQSHPQGQMKGVDANEFKGLVARPVKHNGVEKKNLHRASADNFARAYLASAEEYFGGSIVKWTMTPGADEDGNACLHNLLPTPWGEFDFYYTMEGGTVTVPAQKICQLGSYDDEGNFTPTRDVYFYQPWSEDAGMTMTLAEDGSITMDSRYWYAGAGLRIVNLSTMSWGGYWEIYWRASFWDIDVPFPPTVYYEPDGLYLFANPSTSGYGYSVATLAMMPASAPSVFRNTTLDIADSWLWSVTDGEEVVANVETEDLTFVPEAGEGYEAPYLTGNNQGTLSVAPFQYGAGNNKDYAYMYAGAQQRASFGFSDGSYALMSKSCPDFPRYYFSDVATPDYDAENEIVNLISYQGMPAAPLYFEGISLQVYGFADHGTNLKCKIVKVSRSSNSLELGDVVAEADVDLENSVINETGASTLYWNDFYVLDELGMSQTLDHIFIDEEFAVIFEGWDNGTFSAYALGDYPAEVLPAPSYSTYYQGYDDETGAFDEHVYRMSSLHLILGFEGAAYGYMMTADDTNITIPADGGEAKINVGPMLYYYNENGEAITGIWLDVDAGSDEIPEWLQISYTDPVQVGVDEDGNPVYDPSFDLIFAAQALPAGTTSRSCHLIFYQPGAQLEVNVSQEGTSGISTVVKKTVTNGPAYNLNGQRVNANYKGIVVKDGSKVIKK